MNQAVVLMLELAVVLVLCWWLYFVEYKRYRLDRTRQELYGIRDRLFDDAVKAGLDFENARGYQRVRMSLNGAIRLAHRISLLRLLLPYLFDQRRHRRNEAREYAGAPSACCVTTAGLFADRGRCICEVVMSQLPSIHPGEVYTGIPGER